MYTFENEILRISLPVTDLPGRQRGDTRVQRGVRRPRVPGAPAGGVWAAGGGAGGGRAARVPQDAGSPQAHYDHPFGEAGKKEKTLEECFNVYF